MTFKTETRKTVASTPIVDRTLFVMSAIGMAVLVSLAAEAQVFGDVAIPLRVDAGSLSALTD